jgi:hypothetical protein
MALDKGSLHAIVTAVIYFFPERNQDLYIQVSIKQREVF